MACSTSHALEDPEEEQMTIEPGPLPQLRNSTSKVQAWSESSSAANPRPTSISARISSDSFTDSKTVTKRQSRFASLFLSLLAVSPMAIEEGAADQNTLQGAQRAATQHTQRGNEGSGLGSGGNGPGMQKARWKRGLRLKMKRQGDGEGRRKERGVQMEDMQRRS